MAKSEGADEEPWVRRRCRSRSGLDNEQLYESGGNRKVLGSAEAQRIRIERADSSRSTHRTVSTSTMTPASLAMLPSIRSTTSHTRRRDHHRGPESKHHSRKKSSVKDDSATYVYRAPDGNTRSSRIIVPETRKLGRDGKSVVSEEEEEEEEHSTISGPVKQKTRNVKVLYVTSEEAKASRNKERRPRTTRESSDRRRGSGESVHRSRVHHSRRKSITNIPPSPPKRSASTRDLPAQSRAPLKRSKTTSSHVLSTNVAPSITPTTTTNRRSSLFGSLFSTPAPQHHEPEKFVECLTCLSDDIPRSKSAKLKCGHRMCHSCLKRIFKLSVNDPQHMPPKCCTADFIPLKHVDKLFDTEFKKTWNRKFAEYSTKNRIYCPAKRCGEWIKPGNIHKEEGKKYGKCSRCKTKVCCLCNGKWHGTKDCPKDEETNRLLEKAKEAGWQRCYNCRTMVELKEGCNHMTCRCTAEFCMICGLKWKSCNCPWFNYEAVEADRLNHMQGPEGTERDVDTQERPRRLRRPRPPINYHEEVNERRRQERADEEFARRLQRMTVDGEGEEDYQGGIGDMHGVGNGAGHFMNQDYIRAAHNILTGNFDQATAAANYVMGLANVRGIPSPPGPRRMADRYPAPPQAGRPPSPPPMLRRNSMREQTYNAAQPRPAERVVLRRTRTDYESEAAVHAPLGRAPQPRPPQPEPTPAVLAGLRSTGRARNRVSAWRTHVQPMAPEEGVISI